VTLIHPIKAACHYEVKVIIYKSYNILLKEIKETCKIIIAHKHVYIV